jgi:hypothetical protein
MQQKRELSRLKRARKIGKRRKMTMMMKNKLVLAAVFSYLQSM